jgi:hypothetical protein
MAKINGMAVVMSIVASFGVSAITFAAIRFLLNVDIALLLFPIMQVVGAFVFYQDLKNYYE